MEPSRPDTTPLSVRRGIRKPFQLEQGVPTHMRGLVWGWVERQMRTGTSTEDSNAAWLANILRLPYPVNSMESLRYEMNENEDELLDLVDMLLKIGASESDVLEKVLDAGGSAWRVGPNRVGLIERIPGEALKTYERARAAVTSVDTPLTSAWANAFGREPNPGAAWGDAIKAVEAALHPIVTPRNSKSTLSNIQSDLRNAPDGKFRFNAPGHSPRDTVQAMLDCITWQPGRHGSDPASATLGPARVVVLQATAIIAAVGEGLVERV